MDGKGRRGDGLSSGLSRTKAISHDTKEESETRTPGDFMSMGKDEIRSLLSSRRRTAVMHFIGSVRTIIPTTAMTKIRIAYYLLCELLTIVYILFVNIYNMKSLELLVIIAISKG